jgi:protein TonB
MNDEGVVIVQYTIEADGHVDNPTVWKSSGFDDLDRMACDSVKGWLYHPAKRDGHAIAVASRALVTFRLRN